MQGWTIPAPGSNQGSNRRFTMSIDTNGSAISTISGFGCSDLPESIKRMFMLWADAL